MQIDWLTVSAQWLNFLILVYLLRRFLYSPIIRAMDRRQQAIQSQMEQARQKTEEAESESSRFRERTQELEQQKAHLLQSAREAADQERIRLVSLARDEVDTMAERWRQEIEREKADFLRQLRRQLSHLIIATSHKALNDLASMDLEQALLARFLERLQQIPEQDKRLLVESGNRSAILACSYALSEQMRSQVSEKLNQVLGSTLPLTFGPLPESACGVMLITPAFTLDWRFEHYFTDMDRQLDAALAAARQDIRNLHAE
ncbi:MAG: F0F1 ATP synthase subunit B family protein [Gammaproteobacteria bacterium]